MLRYIHIWWLSALNLDVILCKVQDCKGIVKEAKGINSMKACETIDENLDYLFCGCYVGTM
jgi:hypothetical protein